MTAMPPIIFNSSTYSTSFVQGSLMLQQLHRRHATDCPQFQRLFHFLRTMIGDPRSGLLPPYDQNNRWCSSNSTSSIRPIFFNPSAYSNSFEKRSVMLQQLHPRHSTDCSQSQRLLHLLCTRIGDAPAAPPLPCDRLSSIPATILPPLYKDRWCSSSSISAMRPIVFNSSFYSTSFVQRSVILQQLHP